VFINTQEMPRIPPYGINQAFDDNAIKEIMLFANPPEWQREMDQMGFDPNHSDSMALLLFMENIKASLLHNPVAPRWCNIMGNVCGALEPHTANP
jgi:hypothetical protein